jgi:hypothetical protein
MKSHVYYAYNTSQYHLTILPVLSTHVWLVATTLDNTAFEQCLL